ncbi:MAG: family N-acetyltransferase [Microbacterium sp.]|nr:family N-acetyltransferase [Microbacterium sp.]
MEIRVRRGRPADGAAMEDIEAAADALLVERFGAADWPPPATSHERASVPGFALIAEPIEDATARSRPVGFVHVLEIDGHAHLEQLSVLPSFGRRGIGRLLVHAAFAEAHNLGHRSITLRTFRDVPWNAPFYASCGFAETEPDSPFLRSLVDTETALALFKYGPRVQMTAAL